MHAARTGTALDSRDDTKLVRVEYKGLVFDEPLFSYMKLLDIPVGLLINFHEPVLKDGISRMILPGADRTAETEDNEVSL